MLFIKQIIVLENGTEDVDITQVVGYLIPESCNLCLIGDIKLDCGELSALGQSRFFVRRRTFVDYLL